MYSGDCGIAVCQHSKWHCETSENLLLKKRRRRSEGEKTNYRSRLQLFAGALVASHCLHCTRCAHGRPNIPAGPFINHSKLFRNCSFYFDLQQQQQEEMRCEDGEVLKRIIKLQSCAPVPAVRFCVCAFLRFRPQKEKHWDRFRMGTTKGLPQQWKKTKLCWDQSYDWGFYCLSACME